MDNVLIGLSPECCMVYLDDVVVYATSFEQHIIHLVKVLLRFRRAGLTLKSKKCNFCTKELNYLGFRVKPGELRTQGKIVSAITQFPVPNDKKEVKRFLAMANFYRKFISHFLVMALPLNELLRKETKFEWSDRREKAFEEIKRALSQDPVLKLPDFNKLFYLATDASKEGLGAVLMQEQENGLLAPICYLSRSTNRHEKNYSVTELECLGVVWAVKQLRPYLYGRRFQLQTDHQALKWLMTLPEPTGRLSRWSLELMSYDFEIIYVQGKSNVVPDTLSRAPVNVVRRLQISEALIHQAQSKCAICQTQEEN